MRGFHENFRSAFQHSLDSGCDGFEFDVRLTRDGRLICLHDPAVRQLRVKSSTFEEISNQYFKDLFRGWPKGTLPMVEGIPCLDDLLQDFSGAFLDIELKVAGTESQVLELLRKYRPESYVVSSFLPEVICRIAEIAPEVPLGFVFDDVLGLRNWTEMPGPYVIPRHDLVTPALVDSVHTRGRKLLTWTVNHPDEVRRLADWGVDGLISDDPALLSRTVRGREQV